jgi:SAM-dependent methyltransferase
MGPWKRLRGEASEAVTEMILDLANIQVGDRVLELAAGMGDLAVMTARRVGPHGHVLATDISAKMLNVAAEAAREAGFTNVETRVMDAESIELAPASFNAALCRSALMHFPNPIKARDSILDSREKSFSWVAVVNRWRPGKIIISGAGTAWNVRAFRSGNTRRLLYEGRIPRCDCSSSCRATTFSFHCRSDRGDEGFFPAPANASDQAE